MYIVHRYTDELKLVVKIYNVVNAYMSYDDLDIETQKNTLFK